MKRPGAPVYVFGNTVSLVALVGGMLFCAYQWWMNRGSPWLALLAFVAAGYSASANEQLRKYGDWKREWDAMGGKAPGARYALPVRPGVVRIVLALVVLGAFGFIVFDSGDALSKTVYVLLVIVVTLAAIAQSFRSRQREKKAVHRDVAVTQCLKVPVRSPAFQQAFSALPPYCVSLFDRSNSPSD